MAALVLFALASSVEWLFVARALQGIATGLALSAAGAALLDLHPNSDGEAVGFHNGVASAVGGGVGVLIPAAIFQLLPAPRVLPYVAAFALFALAFAGTLMMAEPRPSQRRSQAGARCPGGSTKVRPAFLLASLGAVSSWSIAGISLALGPELLGGLFHTSNAVIACLGIFAFDMTAAVSQVVFRHKAPWVSATVGSLILALGLLGTVLAVATESGATYVLATVIVGAGFGAAFLGGLRALSAAIPPNRRGSVMSAFYLVAYSSLSIPAILAGTLTTPIGLNATFEILGATLAVVALVVAALAWRIRPLRPIAL